MSNGRLTENGALPDSISLTGGCMGSSATLQSGHTMTGGIGEIFPGKDGMLTIGGRKILLGEIFWSEGLHPVSHLV